VGVIAREILSNGLLVKPLHELDLKGYCSSDAEIERRIGQLKDFREQAATGGTSLPSLALRYASQLDGVSVALIGARSVAQLQSLLAPLSK
jgi:aryl-alcohol dehydrogenase-like predicted oxidoreductase